MGHRPRVRGSNYAYCFYLFPADVSLGWRVIRRVTLAQGMAKVSAGDWREVQDEQRQHVGFQIAASIRCDKDLPSGTSSTSITAREMQLNGMGLGESRTARMSEDQRISRRAPKTGSFLPPEDAIEKAVAKVAEFGRRRLIAPVRIVPLAPGCGWDAFQELAAVGGD